MLQDKSQLILILQVLILAHDDMNIYIYIDLAVTLWRWILTKNLFLISLAYLFSFGKNLLPSRCDDINDKQEPVSMHLKNSPKLTYVKKYL